MIERLLNDLHLQKVGDLPRYLIEPANPQAVGCQHELIGPPSDAQE